MNNKAIAGILVAVLIVGGVGLFAMNNDSETTDNNSTNTSQTDQQQTAVSAADLRVSLNNALREHVNIAGVALRNVFLDAPDTNAAVAALDENSVEVASLVGAAYGEEAEADFLTLWRQHINFFANYTAGARDGDQAAMDQAMEDLAGYGEAAGNFFEGANPENLPKSAVKPLLVEHRDLVLATVDLIGAGDFDAAYVKLGEAADQVTKIADALAGGIAAQMPEKFAGGLNAAGVDLRVSLNNALREHVELAGVALRNLFVGDADTNAAVAALDENSVEVASLVGAAYGSDAEEQFLTLWRQHIEFFASYTTGAKEGDQDKMDQAKEDLAGYGEAASNFFEGANPNLPKTAVKPLLVEHRNLVLATVDLIGAGDFDAAYLKLAEATNQVGTIGDALANGISTQMPEKFPVN